VTTATNAEEAINILEEHALAPDLLVSDVVMPGLGGHELASRLRQRQPGLAVLLMSGYTDDPAVRDTGDARTSFLQKPFTPAALARKVQQLLGRRA
jgi:CheY-like chemotaxis protein